MATFSITKLVAELSEHQFVTHGKQLTINEISDRSTTHPVFGDITAGIRTFEVKRTILDQFVEEIQSDLNELKRVNISHYGIFIHSYVSAKNYEISDDVHMMRYAKVIHRGV